MKLQNPYLSVMTSLAVIGIGGLVKATVDQGTLTASIAAQLTTQGQSISGITLKLDNLNRTQWQQSAQVQVLQTEVSNIKEKLRDIKNTQRDIKQEMRDHSGKNEE